MNETKEKKKFSAFEYVCLFLCGVCMGAADLIPGISGGTIAFILGFYDRLLNSIKTINGANLKLIFQGKIKEFPETVAWKFLLTLLSGILFSFVMLANVFQSILEHDIYRIYLYAGFFGLILASFVFCIRQMRQWKLSFFLCLIVGSLIAYALTGTGGKTTLYQGEYAIKTTINPSVSSYPYNYNPDYHLVTGLSGTTLGMMASKGLIDQTTDVYLSNGRLLGPAKDYMVFVHHYRLDAWLMVCGAIAVCALLLPGISGSYLLTLLGVYPAVIAALAEWAYAIKHFSFDFEAFNVLFSLGIGIVIGLVVFARFVSWLLKAYYDLTIAALSGFMIGALRSVWPFWTYQYELNPLKLSKGPQLLLVDPILPSLADPIFLISVFCLCLGFCMVFAVEYLAKATKSQGGFKVSLKT